MASATMEVVNPDQERMIVEAVARAAAARLLKIEDVGMYEYVAEELKANKTLQKAAHEAFDPICDANHKAWQVALTQRKAVIDPLEAEERYLKARVSDWLLREEQRVAAIARVEREAADQRALEAREAEIEEAEAGGATVEEVKAIAERPVTVTLPPAPPPPARVAGVSGRETWTAEVTDLQALVRHVANNPQHLNLLVANQTAINALVRGLKSMMNVPGVRVYRYGTVAVRV
jgi:hypothetical protein